MDASTGCGRAAGPRRTGPMIGVPALSSGPVPGSRARRWLVPPIGPFGIAHRAPTRTLQAITPCCAPRRRRSVLIARAAQGGQVGGGPQVVPEVFRTPREKTAVQEMVSGMSTTMAYVGAGVVLAASAALGFVVGGRAPENMKTAGKALGVAAGIGGAALAVTKLKESREESASIDLHNELVKKGDVSLLTRAEVEDIEQKYGIDLATTMVSEMKMLYDQFLESMIPPGDEPMTGMEPGKLISFKDALGLGDEDAAAVHMDVGRRLARSRFEVGTKRAQAEQRKAFQKWLYISYRVFGERKAAFLLPLVRVFGLTQSQIIVARRDNAKAIFAAKIAELSKEQGGVLPADRSLFEQLRVYQRDVQLDDEMAEEVLQTCVKERLEQGLQKALDNIRTRTRVKDYSPAMKVPMEEMRGALEFNTAMENLAKEASDVLPPGLGRMTIHGGAFEKAASTADLRDLYRVFLEESLEATGQLTVQLEQDMDALKVILGLGTKEATSVREEVTSTIYRRLLRDEVQSGRLDAAESKAAVLEQLCTRLMFKPESAALMHKSIYKQKVESILEQDNKISDEAAEELLRLRQLMCIPEKDVDEVVQETCGGRLRAAVAAALAAGIDSFGSDNIEAVKQIIVDLRLSKEMAKDALDEAARKIFMDYITTSRLKQNRLDAAKELKKMVFFSNIVVAPLLQEIKGKSKTEDMRDALKEIAEVVSKAAEADGKEEADGGEKDETNEDTKATTSEDSTESVEKGDTMPSTLNKAQKAAENFSTEGDSLPSGTKISSQKEITLANDLDVRDRVDIYRNYLLYCMSGDVISMPMGGTVVLERDMDEFGRLSQLGDVLGLPPMEIMKVHQDLAEQAFREQVKGALADGDLTKEKTESLTEMREKMGLSEAAAQKIIKGVQNERLAEGLHSAKALGELSLQKLLDMKESGVEIENFTSTEYRLRLFEQEIEKLMSDGRGELDNEYAFETLPSNLALEADKARSVVSKVASGRKGRQVVQAVTDLRMKKFDAVVQDINNYLVCNRIVGTNGSDNGSTVWDRRDEVLDLYSVYYWKVCAG
eukprot:evm.model.scf_1083.2 EVM.evm.TU.scf_1083.2   scf_1083:24388-36797(-)